MYELPGFGRFFKWLFCPLTLCLELGSAQRGSGFSVKGPSHWVSMELLSSAGAGSPGEAAEVGVMGPGWPGPPCQSLLCQQPLTFDIFPLS